MSLRKEIGCLQANLSVPEQKNGYLQLFSLKVVPVLHLT